MRIIAELPHPDCRISIFAMNGKFIVKFEQGSLEQSYKIPESDVTGGVDGLLERLDDAFIQKVVERFAGMRKSLMNLGI